MAPGQNSVKKRERERGPLYDILGTREVCWVFTKQTCSYAPSFQFQKKSWRLLCFGLSLELKLFKPNFRQQPKKQGRHVVFSWPNYQKTGNDLLVVMALCMTPTRIS